MNTIKNSDLNKREIGILLCFCFVVFSVLFIFFTKAYPLIVYDVDDWLYISYAREAIPLWGDWNPSRILPEILMPVCASIGVYFIMPFTDNYINSLSLIFALVLCVIITIYVFLFAKFIIKKFGLTLSNAICLSIIFLIFHFLIFRSQSSNNIYMFLGNDVTTYFYYTIPTLLNIILIFCMELYPELMDFRINHNILNKAILLLFLYLAIFSNLFCSYILAIWAGIKVLLIFINEQKESTFDIVTFVKENVVYELILCMWFVSIIYELGGGRADSLNGITFLDSIKQTCLSFLRLGKQFNLYFCLCSLAIIFTGIIVYIGTKQKKLIDKIFSTFCRNVIMLMLLSIIYLILLCAKSKPGYISRPDVLFGIVFFFYMIVFGAFSYIMAKIPKLFLLLPLLICILFFQINVSDRIFKDSNCGQVDSLTSIAIDNDIIRQILDADREGWTEMELHVPVGNSVENNWPFATYGSNRFTSTLYKHGLIKNKINVTIVPDENMNEKYHINFE